MGSSRVGRLFRCPFLMGFLFYKIMGRPIKTGLDYFPLDVNLEDKVELIEAEFGLQAFAIIIKLWQKIYQNGYYIQWDKDNVLLFSRRVNSELTYINSVINSCLIRNIFNAELFEKYSILTSSGIQKRYFNACIQAKRKNIKLIKEFCLINSEFTRVNSEFIEFTTEFSTQSKVKEKKVNEIKGKESKKNENKKNENKEDVAEATPQFNFKKSLLNYGFKENLVDDWLKVRKTKKATNTKTGLERFLKQIEITVEKEKIDKNELLTICIERSWGAYNYDWYINNFKKNNQIGGKITEKPSAAANINDCWEEKLKAKGIIN